MRPVKRSEQYAQDIKDFYHYTANLQQEQARDIATYCWTVEPQSVAGLIESMLRTMRHMEAQLASFANVQPQSNQP